MMKGATALSSQQERKPTSSEISVPADAIASNTEISVPANAVSHPLSHTEMFHTEAGPAVSASSTSGPSVLAESTRGIGVQAVSEQSSAVLGKSTSGNGVEARSMSGAGIHADSVSGPGVLATSTSGSGVAAQSTNGTALYATTNGPLPAIVARSTNAAALDAFSTTGPGIVTSSTSSDGLLATSEQGVGVVAISGHGIGLRAHSDTGIGLQVEGLLQVQGPAVGQVTTNGGEITLQVETPAVTAQSTILLTPLDNPGAFLWIKDRQAGTFLIAASQPLPPQLTIHTSSSTNPVRTLSGPRITAHSYEEWLGISPHLQEDWEASESWVVSYSSS